MALENAQFDTLMRQYDELREAHRHELNEHIREIYEKIPRIREIDDAVASESVRYARKKITGTSSDLDEYHDLIGSLNKERTRLLVEAGYPADYLTMQYNCPICHDTGFNGSERCVCFQKAATDLLYKRYSLGDILKEENFARFSFNWYSDTIKDGPSDKTEMELARDAYDAAISFVAEIGKPDNNLFLYGNTGVGKTFLSHCIAKEALDRSLSVLYFSSGDFFSILAGAAFSRDAEASSYVRMILRSDVLIIDDLGTEFTNNYVVSGFFRVINERIMHNRSTIISTNLSLKEVQAKYNERVFSRITSHYRILKLIGHDIRIRKKLKGDRT
jgi:DNA replication protein DnaC